MHDPYDILRLNVINAEAAAREAGEKVAAANMVVKAIEDGLVRFRQITDNPAACQAIPIPAALQLNASLEGKTKALTNITLSVSGPDSPLLAGLTVSGPSGITAVSHISVADIARCAPEVQQVFVRYMNAEERVFRATGMIDDVCAHIVRLECRHSEGPLSKPNDQQLRDAWASYYNPSNGKDDPTGAMLGIRTCIHGVLEVLKRKLPNQNIKGGAPEKVRAILGKLVSQPLDDDYVNQMAAAVDEIIDQLSEDGKRGNMDRTITLARMQRATDFLDRLLSSVDPARFKRDTGAA